MNSLNVTGDWLSGEKFCPYAESKIMKSEDNEESTFRGVSPRVFICCECMTSLFTNIQETGFVLKDENQ